jgi:hypothetical protein
VWEKRAIPLFWSLLPKLGSSNVTEQRYAIAQILPLSKDYKVVVIAVLKKVRYAQCPIPYVLFPIVPHVIEKGYISFPVGGE